ncbi:unnamed protein product [Rotaria socialis]|uniref:Uncharacterized protein n=1 Tax=Rotaria socialis TaxID=392032 RepID=A0A820HVK3_9BILA|nr:unnamed protein product [Rotaria socialis]CAF3314790.1 unnamed protein product [Rotaria socialis]CAF3463824.1 unnamed protein product [Rotaria socialis]CAF3554928.1 unnamed protein product [Rotaria socialis]CAF3560672.1 unnamed protein product [Rotaria socialis]
MSMEAQFYEALRRQRVIDRRQSVGVSRQVQQPKYQPRYIPVGSLRQDDMHVPWTFNPLRRTKLSNSDQSVFKTEQNNHPHRVPSSQRYIMHGKLHNRFSSMNYIQQW